MRIERTKNASRNMVFGLLFKLYTLIVPFIIRTILLYFMGAEYLGLSSLFGSIFSVLNMAELGVGSAMCFRMYRAIAEDDHSSICALMRLYRTYYRVIGLIIALVGLILTPFVPSLINGTAPDGLNIYLLYLINLASTVASYWLFAYKDAVLSAHQRNDVSSKVGMLANTITYTLQIITIVIFHDFYLYFIVAIATRLLANCITAIIATKMYPQYKPEGKMSREEVRDINKRIYGLFTTKIGNIVTNSVDSIVISAFLGLTLLAIYQNYYYIITAVFGFIEIVYSACLSGIGNSLVLDSKEKNFNDFRVISFLIIWICSFCSCCFLCLFQPFMQIWVGNDLVLEYGIVICIVIYFYTYMINRLIGVYKDAAGIWYKDRFRPLITAGVNLGLNILSVNIMGLYGVVLSTVLSTLLISIPWLIHNLFSSVFDKSRIKSYVMELCKYSVVVIVSCVICFLICELLVFNLWITLIVRLLICFIISNALYIVFFRKTLVFSAAITLVDRIIKGKIPIKRILKVN